MNAISPLLQKFAPCTLASRPGGAASLLSCGRFSIREFLAFLLLSVVMALAQPAAATTTTAQTALSCAGARATTSCTAGEFVTTVTISSQVGSCVSGGYYILNGDVSLSAPNTDRYDIGFFVGENANDPTATTSVAAGATCSVATFPTSPLPWFSSSSNTCGDFKGNGVDTPTVQGMKVYCQADASGKLAVPYVLTYTQDSTDVCTGPSDVKVGTSSKCNKGTASVSGVTVLPAMTKTNNVSSSVPAGTTTSVAFTVGFSNLNAGTLSAVFTDPLPSSSGYTVSSITCSSTPAGNCPAACSSGTCSAAAVTAITQGAGLAISIPPAVNSTTAGRMSFVINGSYAASSSAGSFTNTATAVVNGHSQTASDTITVMAAPAATKSFTPSVVAVGGVSTLSITLSNPNTTVDITGAGFTDSYPSGMVNNGAPSTTCSGATASAPTTTSLKLAGATIPKNSSCTVSVQVKATTTGNNSLPAGSVTSANAVASTSDVSAKLYVAKALVLTASPSTVPNDGTTPSAITATITDTEGAAVPGDLVSLSCTGSALPNSQAATTGAGGQASFAITDTQIETVTCTATDSTGLSASVAVTFSSVGSFNAFETVTAANATSGRIYTKLAGSAFSLDVVAIAGNSQASSFSGNVKLELLANTGTAGSGYGADNCPTSAAVVQTIASTALAGGRSTVSFAAVANAYQDVRVRVSYPAAAPTIVICSTDNFAIRPAGLVLWTDAYAGWTSTPVTAVGALGRSDQVTAFLPSAAATPVIKAGVDFKLYATTTTGANYSGTLTVDSSKLTAQKTSQDTSQEDGGVVGTLTTTSLTTNSQTAANLAANNGIAANVSYSEVGYVYLAAGAYRDSDFTSVDGSDDCVADSTSDTLAGGKYGCLIGNNDNVRLGRFIPEHFDVTGSVQPRSDVAGGSTFTYMDEPMKFTLTVTAYRYVANHAAAPTSGVTQNYAGKFAKLDAATLCNGNLAACSDSANYGNWFATANGTQCTAGTQCMGLGAVGGSTALSTRLALDIASTGSAQPTSSWSAGVGTFAANVMFTRDAAGPDGPYSTLQIGGKPRDSDGVTLPPRNSTDTAHCVDLDVTTGVKEAACAPGSTEADLRRWLFTTDVRFGRLRLSNAFGSEKSSLQMQVQAQYWSGKSWVLNAADNLTVLPATAFALSGALASSTSASAVSLAGGSGALTLAKPNPSATGSVDVAINLGTAGSDQSCLGAHGGIAASLPWLRARNGSTYPDGTACPATYDRDPSARATFGIYSAERRRTVHVRELY